MKTLIVLLTALALFISSPIYAEEQYKKAPLPHYTKKLGYGWDDKILVNNPKHPWNLLKGWITSTTFSLFMDEDKDGKCDVVLEFKKDGTFSADGKPHVIQRANKSCSVKEKEIEKFIRFINLRMS